MGCTPRGRKEPGMTERLTLTYLPNTYLLTYLSGGSRMKSERLLKFSCGAPEYIRASACSLPA